MKPIASLLVFYTLIIPAWKNGPLDSLNTKSPSRIPFLNSTMVAEQYRLFTQIKDPRIRSCMALDFAKFNNPKAVEKLELMLEAEKNDLVKADILSALLALRNVAKCENRDLLAKLMKSDAPSVRTKAAVLYLAVSSDGDALLHMLGKENSLFVRSFLWKELSGVPDACSDSSLRKLLSSEFDENRAGSAAILATKSKAPDNDQDLLKATGDPSVAVRMALAEALAKKNLGYQLLERLSKDTSVSVRGMVARVCSTPNMLDILDKLAKDPDSETRRLAIVSLGNLKNAKATDTILKAFSDEYKPVRTAAEKAIAAISPDSEAKRKIGDILLSNAKSRYSAVTAIGLLGDKRFAEKIEKILSESSNDDLSRRCVEALRRLDYSGAWKTVAAKANCKSPETRKAVAAALGTFAEKKSFPVLVELSKDDNASVAKEALLWMGRIADPFFSPALLEAAERVEAKPDIRSYACCGLAKVGASDSKTLNWLRKLVLSKIIPTEKDKDFDVDYVRASALLACVEMSKAGKQKAKATAEDIFKSLGVGDGTFATTPIRADLGEFVRQIKAYHDEVELKPEPMPLIKPMLTVETAGKKR